MQQAIEGASLLSERREYTAQLERVRQAGLRSAGLRSAGLRSGSGGSTGLNPDIGPLVHLAAEARQSVQGAHLPAIFAPQGR